MVYYRHSVRMCVLRLVGAAVGLDDVLIADAAVPGAPLNLHESLLSPELAPAVIIN